MDGNKYTQEACPMTMRVAARHLAALLLLLLLPPTMPALMPACQCVIPDPPPGFAAASMIPTLSTSSIRVAASMALWVVMS